MHELQEDHELQEAGASDGQSMLVLSDNQTIVNAVVEVAYELGIDRGSYVLAQSHLGAGKIKDETGVRLPRVNVKETARALSQEFSIILSAHCKQLFPKELVEHTKCYNLHPGLNPHNRGWYPQVFSIINKKPVGATLHVIDDELDHGAIIDQKETTIHAWDTSESVYDRVVQLEIDLLRKNLVSIMQGTCDSHAPGHEGNLNLRSDFASLCELEMDKSYTLEEAIDLLRALTHGNFRNAFFRDQVTGRKVWVGIKLEPEQ